MTIPEMTIVCKELKLNPMQVISQFYTSIGENNPFTLTRTEYNELCARGYTTRGMATGKYDKIVSELLKEPPLKKPILITEQPITLVQLFKNLYLSFKFYTFMKLYKK